MHHCLLWTIALCLTSGCAVIPAIQNTIPDHSAPMDGGFDEQRFVRPDDAVPSGIQSVAGSTEQPDPLSRTGTVKLTAAADTISPVSLTNRSSRSTGEATRHPSRSDSTVVVNGNTADVRSTPTGQQNSTTSDSDTAAVSGASDRITQEMVIASVLRSYPQLQAAMFARNIAAGERQAAAGEFDLKLKGSSDNGPAGFYETYRHAIGLDQPLYSGGQAFAGYRIGRGDFQPWYQERQTNSGGEFKAGVRVPLLQNVDIDERRAALWAAQYGRQLAEPDIQAQRIQLVQEAIYAYWEWIAAGESYRITDRVLHLAEDRGDRIRSQVEAGLIDPPELTDNRRLIAERRAKLADAQRKLEQTAIKLSLFWRDDSGNPMIPTADQLSAIALPPQPDSNHPMDTTDIEAALRQRPEITAFSWQQKILQVELSQAENLTLPEFDAMLTAAQDVGEPSSSKRDKSQLEIEAGLFLEVPIQRRKALGKMAAVEGKLAMLAAKQELVKDKIAVDVQAAQVGLQRSMEQVVQTQMSVELSEELAARERQNLDAGLSDLLKVTLREQYAAEAAQKLVDALLLYHRAEADLRAALGADAVVQE